MAADRRINRQTYYVSSNLDRTVALMHPAIAVLENLKRLLQQRGFVAGLAKVHYLFAVPMRKAQPRGRAVLRTLLHNKPRKKEQIGHKSIRAKKSVLKTTVPGYFWLGFLFSSLTLGYRRVAGADMQPCLQLRLLGFR